MIIHDSVIWGMRGGGFPENDVFCSFLFSFCFCFLPFTPFFLFFFFLPSIYEFLIALLVSSLFLFHLIAFVRLISLCTYTTYSKLTFGLFISSILSRGNSIPENTIS